MASYGGTSYGNYGTSQGAEDYARRLGVQGGVNPLRPLLRRAQVGLGDRLLRRTAFGNSLEPEREHYLRSFINMNRPGREESRIAQYGQRNRADFNTYQQDQANLDRATGGGGSVADTPGNVLNPWSADTMGFRRHTYSPEQQSRQLAALMAAINEGQDTDLLQILDRSMASLSQNNNRPVSNGGLLGDIIDIGTGLAGAGAFNPAFRNMRF